MISDVVLPIGMPDREIIDKGRQVQKHLKCSISVTQTIGVFNRLPFNWSRNLSTRLQQMVYVLPERQPRKTQFSMTMPPTGFCSGFTVFADGCTPPRNLGRLAGHFDTAALGLFLNSLIDKYRLNRRRDVNERLAASFLCKVDENRSGLVA